MPVELRLKRLSPNATLPAYQTEESAGLDLAACLDAPVELAPGQIALIPCGFAMALPRGYEGQVRPRSGLASKHGITMPNAPGTIDSDYRGEVKVPLINHGSRAFVVEHGMRIAQMVIARCEHAVVEEVDDLGETVRGVGGFGSTGVR
jgi:dUTP pyrophosphatase